MGELGAAGMGMHPALCLPELGQPGLGLSIRALTPGLLRACRAGGVVCSQVCGCHAVGVGQSGAA